MIPPLDLYRVVFKYSVAAEYCETMLLFKETSPSSGPLPCEDLAHAVADFILPVIANAQSSAAVHSGIYVRRAQARSSIPVLLQGTVGGERPAAVCPPSVGVCITQYATDAFVINTAARSSVIWSGVAEADQDAGWLTVSSFGNWNLVRDAMKLNVGGGPYHGGVWHPCLWEKIQNQSLSTDHAVTRTNLSTRRSRRRRPGVAI